jgi:hypothetical protein
MTESECLKLKKQIPIFIGIGIIAIIVGIVAGVFNGGAGAVLIPSLIGTIIIAIGFNNVSRVYRYNLNLSGRADLDDAIRHTDGALFGYRGAIKKISQYLKADEIVKYAVPTMSKANMNQEKLEADKSNADDKQSGLLIITDKRIILFGKILVFEDYQVIPLDELREYQFNMNGMLGYVIRLNSTKRALDVDIKKKARVQEIISLLDELKKDIVKIEVEKDNSGDSSIEKIEKLSELHDKGILTKKEFEEKKAVLLEKI